MTIETISPAIANIQSRGDLASAFPQTDWPAAFEWFPRFEAAGGFVTDESIGVSVLGLSADQQMHAAAVQDEWQDIFCSNGALLALGQYHGRTVEGGALN